jgi:ribosomal protein L37AE/L43A
MTAPTEGQRKEKYMPDETQQIPHCSKCNGLNVEPKGKMWWCRDCKEYFEHATIPVPPGADKFHVEEVESNDG